MSGKSDPRNRTFTLAQKAYKAWLGGHSFVPHTAELLNSPAWRHRSLYARRFIDRLELEHARHNGLENAYLKLTYRQMQQAGVHSDFIAATLEEVETLGLVTVTHRGAYRGGARNNPNTYRLNYLPWKFVPAAGAPLYYVPTDEWARYTGGSAKPKSVRMHRTAGANSIYTGGAIKPASQDEVPTNSAKIANPPNAPHVWKRSSILRSTTSGAGAPAPAGPPAPPLSVPPGAIRQRKSASKGAEKIGAAVDATVAGCLDGENTTLPKIARGRR